MSGFGSSDGRSDTEACGTHSTRGTRQTPLSSWGALPTPRVPATQAVGDGRDRPALILIPVVCCMHRWMLLGSRVGLGIVMCPLWRSAFGFACLFLISHIFTGHRALGRLGRHCLARQFSRPKRYASCRGAYSLRGHLYGHTCHSSFFTRVAHMCHDMTGPAIMAGRLGARTFCLPLAGIACRGLIA